MKTIYFKLCLNLGLDKFLETEITEEEEKELQRIFNSMENKNSNIVEIEKIKQKEKELENYLNSIDDENLKVYLDFQKSLKEKTFLSKSTLKIIGYYEKNKYYLYDEFSTESSKLIRSPSRRFPFSVRNHINTKKYKLQIIKKLSIYYEKYFLLYITNCVNEKNKNRDNYKIKMITKI